VTRGAPFGHVSRCHVPCECAGRLPHFLAVVNALTIGPRLVLFGAPHPYRSLPPPCAPTEFRGTFPGAFRGSASDKLGPDSGEERERETQARGGGWEAAYGALLQSTTKETLARPESRAAGPESRAAGPTRREPQRKKRNDLQEPEIATWHLNLEAQFLPSPWPKGARAQPGRGQQREVRGETAAEMCTALSTTGTLARA